MSSRDWCQHLYLHPNVREDDTGLTERGCEYKEQYIYLVQLTVLLNRGILCSSETECWIVQSISPATPTSLSCSLKLVAEGTGSTFKKELDVPCNSAARRRLLLEWRGWASLKIKQFFSPTNYTSNGRCKRGLKKQALWKQRIFKPATAVSEM